MSWAMLCMRLFVRGRLPTPCLLRPLPWHVNGGLWLNYLARKLICRLRVLFMLGWMRVSTNLLVVIACCTLLSAISLVGAAEVIGPLRRTQLTIFGYNTTGHFFARIFACPVRLLGSGWMCGHCISDRELSALTLAHGSHRPISAALRHLCML